LLALPLSTMLFVLLSLRIAAALPSDVKAAWIFESASLSRQHARLGMERTMFIVGVLPSVLVFAPPFWYLWGMQISLAHTLISLAAGSLLVQLLLWHFSVMPCSNLWDAETMPFGRWWLIYFAVLILFTTNIPAIELLLFNHTVACLAFAGNLTTLAVLVRYSASRRPSMPSDDPKALSAGNILNLGN
jgi:hypothetical protein